MTSVSLNKYVMGVEILSNWPINLLKQNRILVVLQNDQKLSFKVTQQFLSGRKKDRKTKKGKCADDPLPS